MQFRTKALLAAATLTFASQANAAVCDYTMARLAAKTSALVAGGTVAAGAGMQAAGFYTLVHAGSGLTMLGSTLAGTSAAGTIGIIGGSGGIIGSVGAFLMAPITLIIGGIAVVGVGSYEGYCYFQVDRITDPYKVRKIIESVAEHDDTVSIVATDEGDTMALKVQDETKTYLLRNLYIADGQLIHSDWGPNTNLGPVAFTTKELPEATK